MIPASVILRSSSLYSKPLSTMYFGRNHLPIEISRLHLSTIFSIFSIAYSGSGQAFLNTSIQPAKVSVGDKERIEKTIHKNKSLVDRVAQKLVVRERRVEKARMSKGKSKAGSMPSVF